MVLPILVTLLLIWNTKREIRSQVASGKEWANEFVTGFYNAMKKDVAEELPVIAEKVIEPAISNTIGKVMESLNFSKLGKASGMSRNMKSMEKDLITDFVDSKYPGMGSMAAKYIQKYPFLAQFLGQLNQGNGEGQFRSQGEM